MVYKASLKRRVGIEVFDTEKTLKPEGPCQVVAVKVLQGNCSHHVNSCIKRHIFTQEWLSPFDNLKGLDSFQIGSLVSFVGRFPTVIH